MVREVVSINVGQAGIQVSEHVWEQYSTEHDINYSGDSMKAERIDGSFETFFEHSSMGRYVPRNLCVDLEANVIDEMMRGKLANLFNPDLHVKGREDASNNFARGYYTVGKEVMDVVREKSRHLFESCENCQGVFFNKSVGGGTGSGLGAAILEDISQNYRKLVKIGFEIYPSPSLSTSIVEPYNALMATHHILDHNNVTIVMDNEAGHRLCMKNLDISQPTYSDINRVLSKLISSTTASLRFVGEQNVDLGEFQTNLVPFPRLHFMTCSLAPVINKEMCRTAQLSVREITDACINKDNFLVKYDDSFDPAEDKYMAVCLNYRGDVKGKDANDACQWLKTKQKVQFVDFVPTGFKIGLNSRVSSMLDDDIMAPSTRQAAMISNNVAISRVFSERIVRKFDLMYAQRAYVHWYVGEGMEEGEFSEAREDLEFLEKDYLDVVSPIDSDEEIFCSSADEDVENVD